MGLPTVTQTWTYSFNNRYAFPSGGSALTTMENFMFSFIGVGGFLPGTMGYTVKGSCDGTTGAMDGVNRITAANKWATRVNGSSSPISWIVLTDGAGIDWCFSYNSASDDIVRLAYSAGGNYVAAGTPSNQPTATDEAFDSASGTWTGSTASLDRVWHFWGSSDKKMFRTAIYRQGSLLSYICGEKFTSALVSPATFSQAVGGGTVGAHKGYWQGGGLFSFITSYSATTDGTLSRVHAAGQDINVKAFAGGEIAYLNASGTMNAEKPQLQGGTGELIFPMQLYCTQANSDGKLGGVIDCWYAFTNSTSTPSIGDTFGNLQFFVVASAIPILPLDGVTTPVIY